LTLFLPYRLLSHGARLDERWAVLIFGFGGFLWSLALLRYLCKKYFSGASGRSVAFAGWILGFANYIPMLLRPHCVYEVAVSSGFFFLAGSLYFLSSAFAAEKPSYKKIAWGSLFLGLAAGSRPHFLILSFLLLAVTLFRLSPKDPAKKDYFRSLGALLAPFLAFFCFWMSYNYLRFENVFEAGAAYIPMNPGNYLFHPLLAVPNSYFFLFRPPRLDSYFPYLHLQNEFPDFMRFAHSWYRVIENSVGLLPSVPFAGLLLVSPYAFRNAAKNSTINLRDLLSDFALILFPAAIGLPIFLCFWSVCNRYFADFASFLILSATVVWLTVDACLTNNSGTRNKFRFLVIFLGLISIFSGIIYAVDFRGYNLDHFYLWARS
ncbi:MAG: hypothetical protein WCG06_06655, partial [Candidatus Omnitrophota bacterium]